MKNCLAILLPAVHLFNLEAYAMLFDFFIQRSNEQATKQPDSNQHNDSELIEVKIALHTPYLSGWNEYRPLSFAPGFKTTSCF